MQVPILNEKLDIEVRKKRTTRYGKAPISGLFLLSTVHNYLRIWVVKWERIE